MAISKVFIAVGNWIESRFPEKVTASEVYSQLATLQAQVAGIVAEQTARDSRANELVARISELEKKIESMNGDMNKTKIMLLAQRQTAGR